MTQIFRGWRGLANSQGDKPFRSITNYLQIYFRVKLVIYFIMLMAYGLWQMAYSKWRIACSLLLTILCFNMCIYAQEQPGNQGAATGHTQQPRTVLRGEVRSVVDGSPLEGVSIKVQGQRQAGRTNANGNFSMTLDREVGKVTFTIVGYLKQEVPYKANEYLDVKLKVSQHTLEEVEVVTTGYQKIPKERATGSFEFVDNKLLNRKVSTDFVSRLEDVVPSIASSKVFNNRGDLLNINIRGVSTMRSERWPLIVIDGVPYPARNADYGMGTFNNINPNDIENVTILKDAAASSIWGAQSGNGVIIITTKKGKFNQPFQLSINSNLSISSKPDLYYYPQMSSKDYIEAETFLFDKGYWDTKMYRFGNNLTPVIQLYKQRKEGSLSAAEVEAELERLRSIDMREDFMKYVYRKAVNQQYSVQLRGGGEKVNTSVSLGYDKNLGNLVTTTFDRFTARTLTQVRPIDRLQIDIGATYTESKRIESYDPMGYNFMGRGQANFPYMEMADAQGRPLVVDAINNSPIFRDTIAGGRLLDWKYRPIAELHESSATNRAKETFLTLAPTYQITDDIKISGLYSYQRSYQPIQYWRGMGSVYQREQLNLYANWNKDEITWNIPLGDYLNIQHWNAATHQVRGQVDYNKEWGGRHAVNAIMGAEVREVDREMTTSVYQGYDPNTGSFKPVRYGASVPVLNGLGGASTLVDYNQRLQYLNRFTSYFANAAYTYHRRYTLSVSMRKDASNLFGVKSNDRGQPFWSVGGAWLLSDEVFMQGAGVQFLKLRATYGYNGNVNMGTAAYPIMEVQNAPHYMTNQTYAMMMAPPNPQLRWERVGMLNLGLDFAAKDNRLSGAIEYYIKRPKDLIAPSPIDPTTGFNSWSINSADLDTRGWDISLQGIPVQRTHFQWTGNLVFSYNRTKVSKSYLADDLGKNYIAGPNTRLLTPIEGMDLYSVLTYRWAGLDPQTGEPRGYVEGEVSKDYIAMTNAPVTELDNHGPAMPLYFGSLRNSFRYRQLELSFNISYQLGHKFLRSTFDNRFFVDKGVGHSDYAHRWQKPGDEHITDVPSLGYPDNPTASEFYRFTSAFVEKGDQVKLRDIQLSYQLPGWKRVGVKNARVYAYFQNIGTIWRANKKGVDPEYGQAVPDPLMCSFGLNFNL